MIADFGVVTSAPSIAGVNDREGSISIGREGSDFSPLRDMLPVAQVSRVSTRIEVGYQGPERTQGRLKCYKQSDPVLYTHGFPVDGKAIQIGLREG